LAQASGMRSDDHAKDARGLLEQQVRRECGARCSSAQGVGHARVGDSHYLGMRDIRSGSAFFAPRSFPGPSVGELTPPPLPRMPRLHPA
jgi:hypothetical protein